MTAEIGMAAVLLLLVCISAFVIFRLIDRIHFLQAEVLSLKCSALERHGVFRSLPWGSVISTEEVDRLYRSLPDGVRRDGGQS